MEIVRLYSYAKLNLYLEVLAKRRDGYHNIRTVFERIDLCDRIILQSRQDKLIKVIARGNFDIPQDSSNLAYQSAKLLQEGFRIERGVDITIFKRIPVGSGLAGGSSNAAAVLVGLNKLWKLRLKNTELVKFAAKLGSDVPFFIYNCPFAVGQARGDRISPQKKLRKLRFWHILVVPKLAVSTPLIYKKWDTLHKTFGLTRPGHNVKMLLQRLRKGNPALIRGALINDLQKVTFGVYPVVRHTQQELVTLGLKLNSMSGSGPAIFGIASSRKEAVALYNRIKHQKKSWQVFLTRTY